MFTPDVYEQVSETLAGANAWIAASGARIVNIETVVLPNLDRLDSSVNGVVRSIGGGNYSRNSWHQVIRVWHEETPPPLPGGS